MTATLIGNPSAAAAGTRRRLLQPGWARWALARLRLWRQRARARAQLAQLSDRMLADIGISRAEAEFLANKPFWRV